MWQEDQDLARAIALSLQDTRLIPEVISLDSDEENGKHEEDRSQINPRKALEVSEASHNTLKSAWHLEPGGANTATNSGSGALNFLTERAKLERERLERQKRLRPETFVVEILDDSEGEEQPPSKRHQGSSFHLQSNGIASSSKSSTSIEQLFWNGELRQTATAHADPRKDGLPTFRLTEILGKTSDLALAILSSYSLDCPWIYEFFDPSVPVIMVAQPEASGDASVKIILPNWIRTTPFLRAGFGCQHMKFMLLFYKNGRLRVVISTANLIAYDWRDMENSVWLQDIPLRSKPIPHDSKADDFAAGLQRMLHAVNVHPALVSMLHDNHPDLPLKSIDELRQNWDWSNVKAQLVASIAGKHEGWPQVIQTGHPRLMAAIRKLRMRTGKAKDAKELVLECQGSSLGNYTTQWLNEFHWSARGESAEDWLDRPKKTREKLPYPPIKIVFPTKATVQTSALGEMGGGTIFCRRYQWNGKNFPRRLFHNSKSKAGPVLMHSKMIVAMLQENSLMARLKTADTSDVDSSGVEVIDPAVGWVYVGSHNFTQAAWGTLSGTAFNPVLNITNYELGVVFLLKDVKEADRIACFQRPPEKYTADDEPWIQEESVYHQ